MHTVYPLMIGTYKKFDRQENQENIYESTNQPINHQSINQNILDNDDPTPSGNDDDDVDAFIASLLAFALVDLVLGFNI